MLKKLSCSKCGAIVSGEHCKFCGNPLPRRKGLPLFLGHLTGPFRLTFTILLMILLPWRLGDELARGSKGRLSYPLNTLLFALSVYVGAFFKWSEISFGDEEFRTHLLLKLFTTLILLYAVTLVHAFLRFLGSSKRFTATLTAAMYPASVWMLCTALFVWLHIGRSYQILDPPNPPSSTGLLVEAITLTWLQVGTIIILAKVHALRWFVVLFAEFLASPAMIGFLYLLQYVVMGYC